jgi:hypothetical protein
MIFPSAHTGKEDEALDVNDGESPDCGVRRDLCRGRDERDPPGRGRLSASGGPRSQLKLNRHSSFSAFNFTIMGSYFPLKIGGFRVQSLVACDHVPQVPYLKVVVDSQTRNLHNYALV